MTAFDRFEHELPELMTELAAARVPDYLDDMLRQSARTRQRPRWSALERWIPMGVIARTAPVRQVPWRAIAVAALLIVLARGGRPRCSPVHRQRRRRRAVRPGQQRQSSLTSSVATS